MSTVILQTQPTCETRAIRAASMLLDHLVVLNSSFENLEFHAQHLRNGALPVGSVEFLREAMRVAGINEPQFSCYPAKSKQYWRRNIESTTVDKAKTGSFVKPVKTKLFSGFVLDHQIPHCDSYAVDCDSYFMEQFAVFSKLPHETPIWTSDPVSWKSEWRYYVAHGEIVGHARYDDGAEDADMPDLWVVRRCIADLQIKHPYALDMGVLATGQTALVEVNDAWAIGLYSKALSPIDYLYFLRSRWRGFCPE